MYTHAWPFCKQGSFKQGKILLPGVQSILPCELLHFLCNKLWDSWKYLQSQTSLTSLSALTGNTKVESFNCLFLKGVLVSRASNQHKVIEFFFVDRAIRNRVLFLMNIKVYCGGKRLLQHKILILLHKQSFTHHMHTYPCYWRFLELELLELRVASFSH